MNIIYHSAIGGVGWYVTGDSLFFVGSVFPDVSLLPNEIKLLVKQKKFSAEEVNPSVLCCYRFLHSLGLFFICAPLSPLFSIALLIHYVCDMFTHTGIFSYMPFYPFSKWSYRWGKEILK